MISITVVRCVEHCNNSESVWAGVCGWMMSGMYIQLLLSYDHKTVQYLTNGHTNGAKIQCSHIPSSIMKNWITIADTHLNGVYDHCSN